jgi:hypothetical protein
LGVETFAKHLVCKGFFRVRQGAATGDEDQGKDKPEPAHGERLARDDRGAQWESAGGAANRG